MGASRALINGNIPWEHVTPRQLADGLGARYESIYIPAFISLSDELLDMLIAYVEAGGRVIIDMPSAYLDGYGRTLYTDEGTRFEKLFGTVLNEYGYAEKLIMPGPSVIFHWKALPPNLPRPPPRYWPVIPTKVEPPLRKTLGKGTAVILGAEAS